MSMQEKIIKDYLKINNNPTIKEISKDSGIQQTRVFRILNGSSMKIEEYEIFDRINRERSRRKLDLSKLIFQCELNLSSQAQIDLGKYLNRKLVLSNLSVEITNMPTPSLMTA